MLEFGLIILEVVGLWLFADFAGGLFHWAEDTLGSAESPVWGRLFVRPNAIHHDKPTEMMKIHWFLNNIPILAFTGLILAVAWLCDALTWQVWTFCAIGCWNQQVHRFSHTPRHHLPELVKFLQ